MKRSLRKTTSNIWVGCGSSWFDLRGKNFEFDEESACLRIDVSELTKGDGRELAQEHSRVYAIQIFDEQVVERLKKALRRLPAGTTCHIEMTLAKEGAFTYSVVSAKKSSGVLFDVRFDGDAQAAGAGK